MAHCNRQELAHDLLFYYPTPNAEKLAPHVEKLTTLYRAAPAWLSQSSGSQRSESSKLRRLARHPGIAAMRNWISLVRQFPIARRLAQVIREGSYDLVHVNNTFTYQAPTLLAARLAGIPVVAHVRNPVTNTQFARFLARRARCLVSVADVHSENIRKMDASLRVVTCRDAVERVLVNPESSRLLHDALAKKGEILVGSLGRLDPQKGFEFLIRAAALVVKEAPNVRFAVAGDGTQKKQLEELIVSLSLQEHFRLIGFRSDSGNFLAALDVYAVSSLWEGLPLALLEAMQLKKAVVATAVGGIPEVVRDHVNGILVPPQETEKLAAAILEVIRNRELRFGLGDIAPKAAEPFCDLKARAAELDSLFPAVLDTRLHDEMRHRNARPTVM
ncbi:MAG TPA: glycosyltransferase [Candidatus Acidoferrales bacterium]|nr:glycosyltransferase [Candidatus Acidoferrales bacterium]